MDYIWLILNTNGAHQEEKNIIIWKKLKEDIICLQEANLRKGGFQIFDL